MIPPGNQPTRSKTMSIKLKPSITYAQLLDMQFEFLEGTRKTLLGSPAARQADAAQQLANALLAVLPLLEWKAGHRSEAHLPAGLIDEDGKVDADPLVMLAHEALEAAGYTLEKAI